MAIDLFNFILLYILASLILRTLQAKVSKTSDTGKALAYLFH